MYTARRRSKYGNTKVTYRGITFDSKKEFEYYLFLLDRQKRGGITELRLQVPFELQPAFEHKGKKIRAITYVADFTYVDKAGEMHIVDTKGMRTEIYKLKKKMMQYRGYDIEEV